MPSIPYASFILECSIRIYVSPNSGGHSCAPLRSSPSGIEPRTLSSFGFITIRVYQGRLGIGLDWERIRILLLHHRQAVGLLLQGRGPYERIEGGKGPVL